MHAQIDYCRMLQSWIYNKMPTKDLTTSPSDSAVYPADDNTLSLGKSILTEAIRLARMQNEMPKSTFSPIYRSLSVSTSKQSPARIHNAVCRMLNDKWHGHLFSDSERHFIRLIAGAITESVKFETKIIVEDLLDGVPVSDIEYTELTVTEGAIILLKRISDLTFEDGSTESHILQWLMEENAHRLVITVGDYVFDPRFSGSGSNSNAHAT